MRSLEKLITQINNSSSAILEELDKKDPSFEVITKELDQREKWVEKLGEYDEDHPDYSFEEDELASIKIKFDAFNKLNLIIQNKAQSLLTLQQKKLTSAKKTRQAEDQYKITPNPNISYY